MIDVAAFIFGTITLLAIMKLIDWWLHSDDKPKFN